MLFGSITKLDTNKVTSLAGNQDRQRSPVPLKSPRTRRGQRRVHTFVGADGRHALCDPNTLKRNDLSKR